jgi:hypothetical protein
VDLFPFNTPKSAICARTSLKRIDRLDLNSAIDIAHLLGLSQNEITKYFGHSHSSIGVYFLDRIELAPVEASKDMLAGRLVYTRHKVSLRYRHPPKKLLTTFAVFETTARAVDRKSTHESVQKVD